LPEVLVRVISEQSIRELVSLALNAGVGYVTDLGYTNMMDGNVTVFTVQTADGELRTAVYDLGGETGRLTQDQIRDRRRLVELRDMLLDLPTTLGADRVGAAAPYEPVALAVYTRRWSDTESSQPELAWPGPALVGEFHGSPQEAVACVDVTGADLRAVLDAASAAAWLTPWVWNGERHHIWFRPLLPEESSCADL
jgi:hypothetical protein